MSRLPARAGMLTILSSFSGPASRESAYRNNTQSRADHQNDEDGDNGVPITTNGLRARSDRFGGGGTCSGSSAARGLRGEMGGLSLIDAT